MNQQEEHDKDQMFQYMLCNSNYLERENQIAHFKVSMWTVNKGHTKILMVYHNIYALMLLIWLRKMKTKNWS